MTILKGIEKMVIWDNNGLMLMEHAGVTGQREWETLGYVDNMVKFWSVKWKYILHVVLDNLLSFLTIHLKREREVCISLVWSCRISFDSLTHLRPQPFYRVCVPLFCTRYLVDRREIQFCYNIPQNNPILNIKL